MLTLICLTKSYRIDDFVAWFDYHSSLGCNLCILDNDSTVDVHEYVLAHKRDGIVYERIHGFADQWNLFADILNGKTAIRFADNEIVMFIDDDEYLWFDDGAYSSLECALRAHFKQLGCLLLPEILMSTHHLTRCRGTILPLASCYRRNDFATQGKACIMWNHWTSYSYTLKDSQIGHVPWMNGIRMADVIGSGVTKTTYGICGYDAAVRLYHYHIKSEYDWRIKIVRGSAAIASEIGQNGSYDADITKNVKYGNYNVLDFTMKLRMETLLGKTS